MMASSASVKLSARPLRRGLGKLEDRVVARCPCQCPLPVQKRQGFDLKSAWTGGFSNVAQKCKAPTGRHRGALQCRSVLEAPSVDTELENRNAEGSRNGAQQRDAQNDISNGHADVVQNGARDSVDDVNGSEGEGDESAEERKAREEEAAARKLAADLAAEVAKRRNFAIISHPDAGKTTLAS